MKRRIILTMFTRKPFVSCFLILPFAASISAASCGSATCPLNTYHYFTAGSLHFMLANEYIDQDRIYVGSSRSFVGAIPNDHDEIETINERSTLTAQIGISDALALNIDFPFIHREHRHLDHGSIESFTFSGFGDMVVSAQAALIVPTEEYGPYLSIQGGVKLPTGLTNAANTAGERAEVTIQPGTGSLDFLAGINYRRTLFGVPMISGEYSALPIIINASYQINGKGTESYRMGNVLLVNVGTQYEFSPSAAFLLQVNGMSRGYADVGSTAEIRGNTGGTWIFISPGMSVQINDMFSANGFVQLPVYINVHGIQQAAAFNFQLGLSANFSMAG